MGRKVNMDRRTNLISVLENAGVIDATNRVVDRKTIVHHFPNLNDHVWLTGNRVYRGLNRGTYVVPTTESLTVTPVVVQDAVSDSSKVTVEDFDTDNITDVDFDEVIVDDLL